eukprot:1543910-Rhodomonas_salina.1
MPGQCESLPRRDRPGLFSTVLASEVDCGPGPRQVGNFRVRSSSSLPKSESEFKFAQPRSLRARPRLRRAGC